MRANSTRKTKTRRLAPTWGSRAAIARYRGPRPGSPACPVPEIFFLPHPPPQNWVRSFKPPASQSAPPIRFFSSSWRPDLGSFCEPQALFYQPSRPKNGFVSYFLSRFLLSPGLHSPKLGSFLHFAISPIAPVSAARHPKIGFVPSISANRPTPTTAPRFNFKRPVYLKICYYEFSRGCGVSHHS